MGNFIRVLIWFATACSGISVNALNHREELKIASDWAATFSRPYPIFIFNRDEMAHLFLENGAVSDSTEHEAMRMNLINNYIKDKLKLSLNDGELSNIETYLYTLPNSAVAFPVMKESGYKDGYKACFVFANPPNGNARIEAERLIGLNQKQVFSDTETYDQLAQKMTFEEMYLFSLYHEVSHCLDREFIPKGQLSPEDSHTAHMAESFAETLAFLALSKRLGPKVAKTRSLYRTTYSVRIGEYFVKNPSIASGNPMISQAGVIYFLAPSLLEAHRRIALKEFDPASASPNDLVQVAEEIVGTKAFDSKSFPPIINGLSNGFESSILQYEKMAFDTPEFFMTPYQEVMYYFQLSQSWSARAFDPSFTSQNSSTKAPDLVSMDFCKSIGSQEDFLNLLDQYRDLIDAESFSIESRQEAYQELSTLTKVLGAKCF